VAFYIDSRFQFKIRSDNCLSLSHIECLFLEVIQLGKVNILIECVYRPPGTDVSAFNAELVKILITFDNEKKKIILMAGDYNLDVLKCNTHSPTGDFLNNMLSHSLFPTIRHPTRISDKSSTLLDNIFVNSIQYDVMSAIIYSDISDHLPVAIHLKTNFVKKSANHFANHVYDAKSIENFDT